MEKLNFLNLIFDQHLCRRKCTWQRFIFPRKTESTIVLWDGQIHREYVCVAILRLCFKLPKKDIDTTCVRYKECGTKRECETDELDPSCFRLSIRRRLSEETD